MAAGSGKGIALGALGAGGLLLYAGITNKDIPSAVRALIKGNPPSSAAANPAGVISSSASSSSSSSAAAGDTGAHGASAAANQALAKLSVAISHPSWAIGQQWADWVSLWNRESGWRNLAQNPGSGAFGLAQALGHGTAADAGKYGSNYGGYGLSSSAAIAANNGSALPQIQWGIAYIAGTYGSPSAAWAHEESAGWY